MHIAFFLAFTFALATQAWPGLLHDIVLGDPQDQLPLVDHDEPLTRTRFVTRTHYEINVVSTVYRTRTHPSQAEPTPVHPDEAKQTLVFGVEGTGCDQKACTICRMLNSCSDEQSDCTGCDLAYYCNECACGDKLEVKDANGVHIQKTCTDGQGRSIPCDAVEAAIADRHKVFHFGG